MFLNFFTKNLEVSGDWKYDAKGGLFAGTM